MKTGTILVTGATGHQERLVTDVLHRYVAIGRVVNFDRGFDGLPGLTRLGGGRHRTRFPDRGRYLARAEADHDLFRTSRGRPGS